MRDLRGLWWIPVAGAIIAPLVTWFPMLAYRFPWIGLPRYEAAQGIDFWGAQTFYLVAMTLVACLVGREDKYLGFAVGAAGLAIFWRGATMDPTHSIMFAFGALAVMILRKTPNAYHPQIKSILIGLGVFELLYVSQQLFLKYDLLWGPLVGGQLSDLIQPLGTIGTVDGAAAYIAIMAPLMPAWLLPLVLLVVWKSHAVSATLALAAGLGVKYRRNKLVLIPLMGAAAWMVWSSSFAKSLTPVAAHMNGRGAIWGFALNDWIRTDPVIGYGLGGWAQRIPALQVQTNFAPTNELWREAHNEPLQWLIEVGLIGLILMAMWLWTHRAMFAHPMWGGSLAALGVNALTFFPMHVVQISLVGLILVGLATAPPRVAHADPTSVEQGE